MSRSEPAPAPAPPSPLPADWEPDATLARSGDRAAFARLYHTFSPIVHACIVAAGGLAEADDLTQETFAHAWRAIASLADPRAFPKWITTIARNLAASRGRREQHARAASAALAESVRTMPDAGASPGLTAERALAAIAKLPEAYRETLLMRLMEQLPGPEIARRTGLTEGSVRVNLSRGMELLRAALREESPRGGMR